MNTIFSQKKIKIGITLKTLGLGIIIVGSIFAYANILGWIGRQDLSLNTIVNNQSIGIFIAYCALIGILITMILKNRYKRIAQILIIGLISFIALAYGGFMMGIDVVIVYYLISAYAEEYMKYSAGNNLLLNNEGRSENDLIFFCILIGLGFSVVENMLYVVQNLIANENINIIQLLVGRGLISTLIHIVSTSLIAFIMIRTRKGKSLILPMIIGLLAGFGVHGLYNISLNFHLTYITIPLIIGAIFLMTYLTFHTDIIYKQQQE